MSDWMPPVIDRDEPSSGLEDTPPRDGGAADEEGWAGVQLDPAAVEEGNQLGESIDADNDLDNGGIPMTTSAVGVEPAVIPVTVEDQTPFGPISPDMDPSVPTPNEPPEDDETIIRGLE